MPDDRTKNARELEFHCPPPGWSAEGVEPSAEFKKSGYVAGYKPPAGFFNWFWTSVSQCLEELQTGLGAYAALNEDDKTALNAALSKKLESSSFTAQNLLELLNGASGLNADTLDGKHAAEFSAAGHTHPVATASANGLMAAGDKSKLDTHTASKANPHGVTAAQAGAMPASYWVWSAQSGQPTYLWGGNAQNTYRVWNTSSLSVYQATTATSWDGITNTHAGVSTPLGYLLTAANGGAPVSYLSSAYYYPASGGYLNGSLNTSGSVTANNLYATNGLFCSASGTQYFCMQGAFGYGTNYMSQGPHRMMNGNGTVYQSLLAWDFQAQSRTDAKRDIAEAGEDFGRGLLKAVAVRYRQREGGVSPQNIRQRKTASPPAEIPPLPEMHGFLAEQLETAFPEGVVYDAETGEAEGVSLYGLITGAVALCQSQQREIDALKEAQAVLEARLEKLESAAGC